MTEQRTVDVFAINNARPPVVWRSEWVFYAGVRVAGSDVPESFRQVDEAQYQEALRQQQANAERLLTVNTEAETAAFAARRAALVASGLTEEQAALVLPDA